MNTRYRLGPGTQVREEDFGLLFYTRTGPRLYFLPSRNWLGCDFFGGSQTLPEWLSLHHPHPEVSARTMSALDKALSELREKGVIIGI